MKIQLTIIVAALAAGFAACSDGDGGSATDAADGGAAETAQLAEPCPPRGAELRGTTEAITCSCSPDNADYGVVFGSNPYLDDSGICKSALHAGLLNEGPANITVTPSDGVGMEFEGTEANGVMSSPYISNRPPDGAMTLE